jgi:hypothetical protein
MDGSNFYKRRHWYSCRENETADASSLNGIHFLLQFPLRNKLQSCFMFIMRKSGREGYPFWRHVFARESLTVEWSSSSSSSSHYKVPCVLGSIFIARHFSNQIASHTIIQTSASRQSGIKLVRHNELDQKEMCFPTVQWALDHCLLMPG